MLLFGSISVTFCRFPTLFTKHYFDETTKTSVKLIFIPEKTLISPLRHLNTIFTRFLKDPVLVLLPLQLVLPLKTQEDLDQAVLAGSSSVTNGLLRILLKTPQNNHVSSADARNRGNIIAKVLFYLSLTGLCPRSDSDLFALQYLQVNSRDKQSEMKSSRSLGDLKGSLLKSSERVRKHSTGEAARHLCHVKYGQIWPVEFLEMSLFHPSQKSEVCHFMEEIVNASCLIFRSC